MTADLVVAGGVTEAGDSSLEIVHAAGDAPSVEFRYPALGPGGYSVKVEPWRLSAAVRRTERGWVATAATLGSLGYGEAPEDAVADLLDAVGQYLEFLRDDAPALAPAVAHHANYVPLLDVPRGTWLASVDVDATEVE